MAIHTPHLQSRPAPARRKPATPRAPHASRLNQAAAVPRLRLHATSAFMLGIAALVAVIAAI